VIEKGAYSGGEICLSEYGVGVNVRTGDFLLMDVHCPHGNLPIVKETKDATRLSIVCYLREKVIANSLGHSRKACREHLKEVRDILLLEHPKKRARRF